MKEIPRKQGKILYKLYWPVTNLACVKLLKLHNNPWGRNFYYHHYRWDWA